MDTWVRGKEKIQTEVNVNKSKTTIIDGQLNQNRTKKNKCQNEKLQMITTLQK